MKTTLETFIDTAFAVGGFMWIGIGVFYVMSKICVGLFDLSPDQVTSGQSMQ